MPDNIPEVLFVIHVGAETRIPHLEIRLNRNRSIITREHSEYRNNRRKTGNLGEKKHFLCFVSCFCPRAMYGWVEWKECFLFVVQKLRYELVANQMLHFAASLRAGIPWKSLGWGCDFRTTGTVVI